MNQQETNLPFQNVTDVCKSIIEKLQNDTIRNIYQKFSFQHLNCKKEDDELKNTLFNIFNEFNFISYEFVSVKNQIDSGNSILINAIICVEKQCFIIENIKRDLLTSLFNEIHSSLINISFDKKSIENEMAQIEVSSFCEYFRNEIKSNKFIDYTIKPIICYLIRRYYYPSSFFKDQSFFSFDKTYENIFNIKFNSLTPFSMNKMLEKEKQNLQKIKFFNKDDFIELRQIYSNEKSVLYLVLHLESLYIFILKSCDKSDIQLKHEIDFCSHYSHRCLTRFYGFIKESNKITGFIYEFMSNSDLLNFINSKKISKVYAFMAMIRIFQGINYLHNNCIIHRDIKPSNILIDHDFIPYISDFDNVKKIENEDDKEMTQNIGSIQYASPEQIIGNNISYTTDIYSFGQLIYFLFEGESMFKNNYFDVDFVIHILNENKYPKYKNIPKNIQYLFEKCIQIYPNNRFTRSKIIKIIYDEMKLTNYLKQYLLCEKIDHITIAEIKRFVYEIMIFMVDIYDKFDNEKAEKYLSLTFFFLNVKENRDISQSINNVGFFYYEGHFVKPNFLEAKEYFKMAAKLNNPDAIYNLGTFYTEGIFKQDYKEAKKYFELAARQNHTLSFLELGKMYLKGYGVIKNYLKVKEYMELAAKDDNSGAFFFLGYLYYYGYGVQQNYLKAKEYFEIAAKNDDKKAINYLGKMYFDGKGVERNYEKAKEYYEIAAKDNDLNSKIALGIIYYEGFGVVRDYLRALYYFEMCAKQNHPEALYWLGIFYYEGQNKKPDYSKAIKYFKLAAKHNHSLALSNLGKIYAYGSESSLIDVKKARKYFESSAKLGDSTGLYNLGVLYFTSKGVDFNYEKSKIYLELSAKQGNLNAYFYLGFLYENKNINLAIEYFLKCSSRSYEYLNYYCNEGVGTIKSNNDFYYISHNELGLIYITDDKNQNIESAFGHLKEAGFNEYAYGQNNLGLYYQYFLNQLDNAKHMFNRALEHNFPLADFNIAHLLEQDGKYNESFEHYVKASNNENEKLRFRNIIIYDEKLDLSKIFIIFLTNLKITQFYLSNNNELNAKKYFIKAIFSSLFSLLLQSDNQSYSFQFNNKSLLSDLKDFIFNYPLFDISHQIKLNAPSKWKTYSFSLDDNSKIRMVNINCVNENHFNDQLLKKNKQKILPDVENEIYINEIKMISQKYNFRLIENTQQNYSSFIQFHLISDENNIEYYLQHFININEIFFYDIKELKKIIDDLIEEMNSILFKKPYTILFGRIQKHKSKEKPIQDIDQFFYRGFYGN